MVSLNSKLLATIIPLTVIPVSAVAATFFTIATTTGIAFGNLNTGVSGGGFRVRPDGSSGPTGGSTVASVGVLTAQPGQVAMSGPTGVPITVSVTSTMATLNGNLGGTMTVNDFHLRTNAGGVAETFTLTVPTVTFPVGATLNVTAAQMEGSYTGTFTLNASY